MVIRLKPLNLLAMLAIGASLATSATAETYTLLIYESPSEIAKRTDTGPDGQAYWAGYNQFAQALIANGFLRGGSALKSQAKDDKAELGGYFIIEAASLKAAQDLAKTAAKTVKATIEVRETYPNPTMAQ